MAENDERLSIISAEGGIFDIMTGLYSDGKTNIDIYLKSHAGEPWSCHRQGRGSINMNEPALTISTAIQSEVIRDIGKSRKLRGRGMVARILPAYCKSLVGYRERRTDSISDELKRQYEEHLKKLLDFPKLNILLTLSPEAQSLWNEFYNDIETEMRPGGSLESLKDFGSKLPGAVARIAGLFHCAEYGMIGADQAISGETMRAATVTGAYFKEHSLAMLGAMGENPQLEAAKLILEYIKEHKPKTLKGRDVLMNKNAFRTMEDVQPGLNILVERGHLREAEAETTRHGRGRPEATVYLVNPKILYPNLENQQH